MSRKTYWQQFHRQRITRRRMLAATGVGAAGLAVVAACGGGDDDDDNGDGITPEGSTPPSAGAPVRGGTLSLSVTADWGTIDPVTSVGSGPGLFARVYNALIDRSRLDSSFTFNDLAEGFEQPDDETFIFNLRSGVKIAPNDFGIEERDMDSSDCERWLERIAADEGATARAFTEPWIASSEASDAQTFTIKTNGPYAYFLLRIGPPLGSAIPPKEFFEQEISLTDQGVGAGPFGMIRPGSVAENGKAIADRNPNYYGVGEDGQALPYIDTVEWTQILDRQPRRTAFIGEQIHQYTALDIGEMEELVDQIGDVEVAEDPSNTFIALTMNPNRPPWDDPRLRQAANFALNRQEFVDRIVGTEGGQINGLVHWSTGDFALPPDELAELQPHDPQRTKALIEEATGEDSVSVKIMYPVSDIQFHDQHLPIFLDQMRAAGFDVEEEPLDFATWFDRYLNVDYDASLSLNQIYETAEIPLDFQAAQGPQGDGLYAVGLGGIDAEVEEAILNTKSAPTPEDHVQRVQDAQRLIYDRGPTFLPIMTWTQFVLRHGFLKNVTDGLGGTGLYLNREWWLDL